MRLKKENVTSVMEIVDTWEGGDHEFNFAEYVFMRRVNLGWGHCAGGVVMSKIAVACGLRVAVPGMIANDQDVRMLIEVYAHFSTGSVKKSEPYLDIM